MDEKSTLEKKCNSQRGKNQDLSPSSNTLDIIKMFARVYSSPQIELHTKSIES